MVTNLFPVGMVVGTRRIDRRTDQHCRLCLNALSTVFTMDIYVKKFRPLASQKEIIRTGHVVTSGGSTDFGDHHHCHRQYQRIESVQCIPIGTGIYRTAYGGCFPVRHLWKRTTTMAATWH
mgnify:CR=1 FL=1